MLVFLFTSHPEESTHHRYYPFFSSKEAFAGEKIHPMAKLFLALLYPTSYNSIWKSFELRSSVHFFTNARNFFR